MLAVFPVHCGRSVQMLDEVIPPAARKIRPLLEGLDMLCDRLA